MTGGGGAHPAGTQSATRIIPSSPPSPPARSRLHRPRHSNASAITSGGRALIRLALGTGRGVLLVRRLHPQPGRRGLEERHVAFSPLLPRTVPRSPRPPAFRAPRRS